VIQSLIRPRRIAAVGVAVFVIAASACSSSDEKSVSADAVAVATDPPVTDPPVTDPPVTDPPVTDPPVTDPPVSDPPVTEPALRDLSFLWNDVAEMADEWDHTNSLLNTVDPESVVRLELTEDDLEVAGLQSAGEGFAATDAFTAGFISGTIDPAGEVSALVTTIYPDDDASGSLLATSLGAVMLPWTDIIQDDESFSTAVGDAYGQLLADGLTIGEQRFVRGPEGLTYVAVLTTIEVEATGRPAIEIAVIPVPVEETALSVVELLRLELRAVTD
jgi:hypothetical protein